VTTKYIGKFFLFVLGLVVFTLILFPLDDLGDFVTSQVAKVTQNTIYVRFDRMGLSIVPQPGLELNDVYVETAATPPLSVQEMTLTPSLGALLHQQPFGHFSARGFMKGEVDIEISNGKRTEEGRARYQIDFEAEKLSLNDIRDLAGLPMVMRGQVDLNINEALVDPFFTAQPEGEVAIKIGSFDMPATILPYMGGISVPELKLGQIVVNGRLSGGRLNISSGKIGSPGDEVHGDIKGNIGITFQNTNGIITPFLGSYSLEVDLSVQNSFGQKVPLLDMALQQYKAQAPLGSSRYRMKLSASNIQLPPNMEALR
jgi:type II secretion system protein N